MSGDGPAARLEPAAAASGMTAMAGPAADERREQAVRAALQRVLASPDLCTSPRLGAFLRYVVDATLAGRTGEIKGYTIAIEALGRPHSFDPQADPIVRVEATRLRRALQNYYNTVGRSDPIRIEIPKGTYVPQFRDREPEPLRDDGRERRPDPDVIRPQDGAAASCAPGKSGEDGSDGAYPVVAAAHAPSTIMAVTAVRRRMNGTRFGPVRLAAAVAVVAALATGAAIRIAGTVDGPVHAWFGDPASQADRVRLPVVEVSAFERDDGSYPSRPELRNIEERLRDSFARFDFVEVRAGSSRGDVIARECTGRRPRSVFSLGGLAESRGDGSYALLLHLTDRCDGVIVWSHAIEGLRGGTEMDESEHQVVREVASELMPSYGVVPARARLQVRAKAPSSAFGCIAEAFAVLRSDGSAPLTVPRACLADLVDRDGEFALGHAVRAAAMLDEAMRDTGVQLQPGLVEGMLREAETAVDLAPASAYAARTLAMVRLFAGETEAAVASGERALRLNPLDLDIAASVGAVLIGAGRVSEGEALLMSARAQGATRTPLQETYLAIAAFLRNDPFAAQARVQQLQLHPSPGNRVALALVFHALGRGSDERDVVRSLVYPEGGGPEAVRRLVRHLLPEPRASERALVALEQAGLSQNKIASKIPRG